MPKAGEASRAACVLDQGGPGPAGSFARHRHLAQLEILCVPGTSIRGRGCTFQVVLMGTPGSEPVFPLAESGANQQTESCFRVWGGGETPSCCEMLGPQAPVQVGQPSASFSLHEAKGKCPAALGV